MSRVPGGNDRQGRGGSVGSRAIHRTRTAVRADDDNGTVPQAIDKGAWLMISQTLSLPDEPVRTLKDFVGKAIAPPPSGAAPLAAVLPAGEAGHRREVDRVHPVRPGSVTARRPIRPRDASAPRPRRASRSWALRSAASDCSRTRAVHARERHHRQDGGTEER